MPVLSLSNRNLSLDTDQYSTHLLRYKVDGGDLVLSTPLAQIARLPVATITDGSGQAYTDQSIMEYLDAELTKEKTGGSETVAATLSDADRAAIIADVAAQVTTNSGVNDLGSLAVDPSSPADGNYWYNSTEGAMKQMTPSGIITLDKTGDLIIQDLSGNTITTD